jgi:glutamate-ammonia-ligase adenylyltransferase
MALTRARIVAGNASLNGEITHSIATVLARPRDPQALAKSVREMRALIAQEKGENNPWDLKLAAGGVIDVEFLAQYLVLRGAETFAQVIQVDSAAAIAQAGRCGLIPLADAELLVEAHRLYSTVTQMMRLTVEGEFDPKVIAKGVLRRIAAAADCPDFARLERQLSETRQAVRKLFTRMLA